MLNFLHLPHLKTLNPTSLFQLPTLNNLRIFYIPMKLVQRNELPLTKQSPKQQLSTWQKMIKGIIRPPRSTAKDPLSNSKQFRLNEETYTRSDHTVLHNQKKIQLMLYEPQFSNGWVILYLHGNSSSRVESYSIRQFLPRQYSLASFDFMGCGKNYEEDIITLGYRECQQVDTVVQFLKEKQFRVILWGRSMGAATALKYGKADVIVADSAFKSFRSLCKQVAKANSPCFIPNCLVSCLFPCVFSKIRSDIEQEGHYDVDNLDIAQAIKAIKPSTFVIFMSGDQDILIDKRNSTKLYNMYAGRNKHLQIFKGNHNTKRPAEVLRKIMDMIRVYNQRNNRLDQKGITIDFIDEHPKQS